MLQASRLRIVVLGFLALAASACGDDDATGTGGAGGDGGAGGASGDGGAGGSGGADACQVVTVKDLRFDLQDDVVTGYVGAVDPGIGTDLDDQFFFQFYNIGDFQGMPTGSFDLSASPDDNFGTCGHCILVTQDFNGQVSEKFFFQKQGTLTLEKDPVTELDLVGSVTGLELVEVTLDPETLASTPVPGGACLTVPDLQMNYKYLPAGWTCAAEKYRDGATCDCACGAPDADCDLAPGLPVAGCDAEQACVGGTCFDTCSAFAPTEGCAEGVCSLGYPEDLCYENPDAVTTVGIGEACPGDVTTFCAIAGSNALGLCDRFVRLDGVCRGICLDDADCDPAQYERCYALFGDLSTEGFCAPIYPVEWTCSGALHGDGATCECACGAPDPDCADHALPVSGCDPGQVCVQPGLCAAPAPNDTCAAAAPLPLGTTSGTTLGAMDDYGTDPTEGECIGFAVQAGPDVVYSVDLSAGQVLDVTLESAEIDVNTYLFGPGDASACQATLEGCAVGLANVNQGEHLVFTAPSAGVYLLIVDSPYSFDVGGAFTMTAAVD